MADPIRLATLKTTGLRYIVKRIDFRENEVIMRSEDLSSKQKFVAKVLNDIHRVVDYPKKNDLNRLLEAAEIIEVDDDATELGQFKNRLTRFLDELLQDDKAALNTEYKAWRDAKSGRSWFKSDDLVTWLKRERIYEYRSTADVFLLLRALGGESGVLNLGKSDDGKRDYGSKRCWYVPLNPRANVVELDGLIIASDEEAPF